MKIFAPLPTEPKPILQKIEVASSFSIPSFHLIGLAGPEVAEARERVRAAIEASGFEFPKRRVVVNLSPASVRKRGTGADLAIALAVIASASSQNPFPSADVVAWGELSLDGRVKASGKLMRGIWAAWKARASVMVLSNEEILDAWSALELLQDSREFESPAPRLMGVHTLAEAWSRLKSDTGIPTLRAYPPHQPLPKPAFGAIKLEPQLERLIGVAASGAHHLILVGPRGSGKSHALEWLIALQPDKSARLRVEQQLVGELSGSFQIKNYRRVSAQCRPASLVGGSTASMIRPGEFSLAHGSLLIADELPEWPRDSREALREPLERGFVTITRSEGSIDLPAQFRLAATGNFCPCGGWPAHLGFSDSSPFAPPLCRCGYSERRRYLERLSGPLLDRIDLCGVVGPETRATHLKPLASPGSMLERCERAREISLMNWGSLAGELTSDRIESLLGENRVWEKWIGRRASSLRSRHKIIRVALSLASWDGATYPRPSDFSEAQLYRPEEALAGQLESNSEKIFENSNASMNEL